MTLSEAFETFRSRLELDPTYDSIVQQHHSAIRNYIKRSIPQARTQLIGSLQRRTRIDPLTGLSGFDIDILVQLGTFTAWAPMGRGITCDDALNTLENAIRGNLLYRRMGPYEDQPAIVIPYSDGSSVELVPAYKDMIPGHSPSGRAYWVPRMNQWKLADYDFDADYISATNQDCGGRLVPAIKMLKAWRRHVLPLLRSYHLEVLAAAITPTIIGLWQSSG